MDTKIAVPSKENFGNNQMKNITLRMMPKLARTIRMPIRMQIFSGTVDHKIFTMDHTSIESVR